MKKLLIMLLMLTLLLCGCGKKENAGNIGSFTTVDLEGNKQTESIFAETKVTMLNYWGTYCGPCIQEMPHLADIAEQYKDSDDFQIVGLIIDVYSDQGSAAEKARQIVDTTGVGYTNLVLNQEMQPLVENVMAVPTTIFVDEKGNQIGEPYVGARDREGWQAIIDGILEDRA